MSNRSRGLLHNLDLDHLDDLEDLSSEDLEMDSVFGKSNKASIHKHPEFKGNIKDKKFSNQRREKRKSRLENKHSFS